MAARKETFAGVLQVGETETLSLHGSDVLVTGELIAPGGTVQVLGNRVGLFESALVDVSSGNGGGAVYVGGAFGGGESLPTAQHTVVGPGVVIAADGLQASDGGEIVVWSDDTTQAYGIFSAQGGQTAGDGGLIEVSGKLFLEFQGTANTQAPNGDFGTLLLDPTNIRIVSDAEAETTDLTLVSDASFPDLGGDGDTKLAASALENVAANTNIVLEATNDISFDEDVVIDPTRPNVSLEVEAGNDIVINRRIEFRGSGDIDLMAGNDILITSPLAFVWTYGGDASLKADNEVALTNAAQIDTAPFVGLSGDLTVTAPNIRLSDGAQFRVGTLSGGGGTLNVSATEAVTLDGFGTGVSGNVSSGLNANADPGSTGSAGNIIVTSPVITVQGEAAIRASTFGLGGAGEILIQGTELLEVVNSDISALTASINPLAAGGKILIDANQIIVREAGVIDAGTLLGQGNGGRVQITDAESVEVLGTFLGFKSGIVADSRAGATGDAGTIEIDANQILVEGGGEIDASTTGGGNGGRVQIVGAESVEVSGTTPNGEPSGIFARTVESFGNAGVVEIETDNLIVRDFAEVSADGNLLGNAGFLNIQSDSILVEDTGILTVSNGRDTSGTLAIVTDNLTLRSGSSILLSSLLGPVNVLELTATGLVNIDSGMIIASGIAGGQGSELGIQANQLLISNDSTITTSSLSSGNSGDISIQADDFIEVSNSRIFTNVISGSGLSGDLLIRTDNLRLTDSAYISSGTIGVPSIPTSAFAEAGDIEIIADSVFADNRSLIETISNLSDGGNITFDVSEYILLRQISGISATAGFLNASGDGGSVMINSPFVVSVLNENSDITANAFSGSGGRVTISARDIIGLEFQDELTPFSDITASSVEGDAGITEFNRLTNVDVQEGLNDLPINLVDPTSLIDQRCDLLAANNTDTGGSQFTVVGRGGLPTTPNTPLNEEALLDDLGPVVEDSDAHQGTSDTQITNNSSLDVVVEKISEPQGWVRNADGQLVLYAATRSTESPIHLSAHCASVSENFRQTSAL